MRRFRPISLEPSPTHPVPSWPVRITINGDAPLVGVNSVGLNGLVGEQQIKNLPLNGRSYDELLTLSPSVVNFTAAKTGGIGVSNSTTGNNFAVDGNRPQQNLYLLYGVESPSQFNREYSRRLARGTWNR
jgi:hypothetical protein